MPNNNDLFDLPKAKKLVKELKVLDFTCELMRFFVGFEDFCHDYLHFFTILSQNHAQK